MSTHPLDPLNGTFARVSTHLSKQAIPAEVDELFGNLFTEIASAIENPDVAPSKAHVALDELFGALQLRKTHATTEEWEQFIQFARRHPLRELVHQDPFTWRAFHKPRGYAGDAKMLDYIYGREEQWSEPECSLAGRRVFRYTTAAPASQGVRARRAQVADALDRLASSVSAPEVLAVACGHLRESLMAASVKRRRFRRFLALDADERSLEEVRAAYGYYGIEPVHASFRKLITNRLDVGTFDYVYSTGLFDYLQQPVGQRLVSTFFQMLKPGGELMVGNFMPGIRDIGYMEAYMDWSLVYRNRWDMVDLTAEIPQEQIETVSLYAEENQNIIFLSVRKRR